MNIRQEDVRKKVDGTESEQKGQREPFTPQSLGEPHEEQETELEMYQKSM